MNHLVIGRRAVSEALEARTTAIQLVYVEARAGGALAELAERARKRGVRVEEHEKPALDQLARGERHQGIVAVTAEYRYASLDETLAADASPLLVALDEITDPHNFGAIVRSAVAFGATGVITLKHRAAPVTPVVVRASAGATEHARIVRVTNLASTLAELADQGLEIVGLDAGGTIEIGALAPAPHGRVVVVGAEGRGLRRLVRERCQVIAGIPMAGPLASLNASVAAGIAIFSLTRGRHHNPETP